MAKKPAKNTTFNVPAEWKGPDKRFGESIKESVDVLAGNRGNPLDRAVTARDLIDSGIASLPKGANFYNGASDGLRPSTQDLAIQDVIPAPTNLNANGAFQAILLTWDLKTYNIHNVVQVFRHTSDSISDAQMVAQVSGYTGVYSDGVGGGQTFYYWVRAVNSIGETGPFNATAGTLGTTQTDVAFLLDALTDSITESELAQTLVDTIEDDSAVQAEIDALDQKLEDLKNTPAWAVDTDYVVGDLVSYSGNLYSALTAHTSTAVNAPDTTPQNSTEWRHIGAYGSIIDVLAQTESTRATLVSDYITTVDSNAAIAGAKTELRSAFYGDALGLSDWSNTTFYNYSASQNHRVVFEDKVYVLLASSQGNQPDISPSYWGLDLVQSESSVAFKHYTKADADSAISQSVLELRSDFYEGALDLPYWSAQATYSYTQSPYCNAVVQHFGGDLSSRIYLTVENISSSQIKVSARSYDSNPVDVLVVPQTSPAMVGSPTYSTLANGTMEAVLNYTGSPSSVNLNVLWSKTNFGGNWAVMSGSSTFTMPFSATCSFANSSDNVRVVYDGKVYELLQSNTNKRPDLYPAFWAEDAVQSASSVKQEHYTRADADAATAGQIATATSGMPNPDGGTSTVTVQQAMTTQAGINGQLSGQYTVKIDADGSVAGFGLANTNNLAGDSDSRFYVNADQFAILPAPSTSFTQLGYNLISGGNFSNTTDILNFTCLDGSFGLYWYTGRMDEDGGDPVYIYQAINTTVGEMYRMRIQFYGGSPSLTVRLSASTTSSPSQVFASTASATGSSLVDEFFIATTSTTYILVEAVSGGAGSWATFDNLTVYRVLKGTRVWSNSTTYQVGDVVYEYDGDIKKTYTALIGNYSSSPKLNITGSSPKWKRMDVAPFAVYTEDETLPDGTVIPAGTYIDTAFIRDGTITTAQIENATVDMLNVTGDLSADRIVGGQITTSLLNIDGNQLTTDATTGELMLQTSSSANDGKGVTFENLSYDAVGVLDIALGGSVSIGNQTASLDDFLATNPASEYGSTTLPLLHEMTIPAGSLKETGLYILEIGADTFGSFTSNSKSAIVMDLEKWNTSINAFDYQNSSASGELTGTPGRRTIQISRYLIHTAGGYKVRVYGYMKNVGAVNGTKGFYNNSIKLIKLHKTT
jgi:hypothetical protein